MLIQELTRLEGELYRSVNTMIEPLARLGFGSPSVLWPTGVIVVETKGRKTGRLFNVPLMATQIGDLVVVSTFRRKSQWVKNLAANPHVRYWMRGATYEASAFVFAPGTDFPSSDQLPLLTRFFAVAVRPYSYIAGGGIAILAPQHPGESVASQNI